MILWNFGRVQACSSFLIHMGTAGAGFFTHVPSDTVLLSLYLHVASHPPGPLHRAWASHNDGLWVGRCTSHVVSGFQGTGIWSHQVRQGCLFLEMAPHDFGHILLFRAHSSDQGWRHGHHLLRESGKVTLQRACRMGSFIVAVFGTYNLRQMSFSHFNRSIVQSFKLFECS